MPIAQTSKVVVRRKERNVAHNISTFVVCRIKCGSKKRAWCVIVHVSESRIKNVTYLARPPPADVAGAMTKIRLFDWA